MGFLDCLEDKRIYRIDGGSENMLKAHFGEMVHPMERFDLDESYSEQNEMLLMTNVYPQLQHCIFDGIEISVRNIKK